MTYSVFHKRFFEGARLHRLLKDSILFLLLGGAAVHRCDHWLVFSDGFSRAAAMSGHSVDGAWSVCLMFCLFRLEVCAVSNDH